MDPKTHHPVSKEGTVAPKKGKTHEVDPAPEVADASANPTDAKESATLTTVGLPVKSPPAVTLPALPRGFVPGGLALRGNRPTHAEVAMIPDAVAELQNFDGYDAMFGVTAPPVDQLTQSLLLASDWADLAARVSAFDTYVKTQEGMAWKDAMSLLSRLKVPFQIASDGDSSIAGKYPAITRLVDVWKTIAKRATSTKSKKKKAVAEGNAKIAAKVAAQEDGSGAAPQASQPAAGTSTTPQATRTVTMTG